MTSDSGAPLLVLGLGNVLCGDDGLGVAALRRLERDYRVPESVRLLDGGTLGLALLAHFDAAEDVLIVDAIGVDAPPGTLVRLDGDDVEPAVRERLSVHQVGVADLLDALRLLDAYPKRVSLLGLVPATLELGLAPSAAVQRALPALIDALAAELRARGHQITRRVAEAEEGVGTENEPVDAGLPARALGL